MSGNSPEKICKSGGIDLKKLIAAGRFISAYLGRLPQSKVNLALGGPYLASEKA